MQQREIDERNNTAYPPAVYNSRLYRSNKMFLETRQALFTHPFIGRVACVRACKLSDTLVLSFSFSLISRDFVICHVYVTYRDANVNYILVINLKTHFSALIITLDKIYLMIARQYFLLNSSIKFQNNFSSKEILSDLFHNVIFD